MKESAREKYNQLKSQLDDVHKSEQDMREQKRKLGEELNSLIGKVILEEKLLSKGDWIIDPVHYGDDTFYLNCEQRSSELKELSELAERNYHYGYSFENAELRFDDGRITLFLKSNDILRFVKEHGLKLNSSSLDEEILDKKNELASLEKIKSVFVEKGK